jgi:hypothetical protein
MKPFLALFRAGPDLRSLPALAQLASADVDIAISWAGDSLPGRAAQPELAGAAFVHAAAGPKWPALAQTLATHWEQVAGYSHVLLADASLDTTPETLAQLFAVCAQLGLDLAQPAFVPGTRCSHPVAWQHGAFQLRFTNHVDLAAPVFSRALLERAAASFVDPACAASLGGVWPQLAGPGRVAVVDATPMALRADPLPPTATVVPAAGVLNLGGLLDSGDAVCLDARPTWSGVLLEAVLASCRGFGLDAAALARYLANHLEGGAGPLHAAVPVLLEQALGGAGLQFNRTLPVPAAAAHAAPVPAPAPQADAAELALLQERVHELEQTLAAAQRAADPAAVRAQALREADLRDLRERHAALQGTCERQRVLLADLAAQLGGASVSALAAAPARAA